MVHILSATTVNVHDVTEIPGLLKCGGRVVWGDAGYLGG